MSERDKTRTTALTGLGEALVVAVGDLFVEPDGDVGDALCGLVVLGVDVGGERSLERVAVRGAEASACYTLVLCASLKVAAPADDDLLVVLCERAHAGEHGVVAAAVAQGPSRGLVLWLGG